MYGSKRWETLFATRQEQQCLWLGSYAGSYSVFIYSLCYQGWDDIRARLLTYTLDLKWSYEHWAQNMFTVMRASHYQSIQKTHDFRERQLKNTSLQANMGLWTVVNWDIGTPASITKVPRLPGISIFSKWKSILIMQNTVYGRSSQNRTRNLVCLDCYLWPSKPKKDVDRW